MRWNTKMHQTLWMNEWIFISLKQKGTFMNEKIKWKNSKKIHVISKMNVLYIGRLFTNFFISFLTMNRDLLCLIYSTNK